MLHAAALFEASISGTIDTVLKANAQGMHPRLTVTDREHGCIHYETGRAAMYVAVSPTDYPQRVAFRCIAELRSRFESGLGDALHKAEPGGLSKASKPLMSELCGRFADASKNDKTLRVMKEVDEVKEVVGESIQHLLATHENLEVLEDRSEQLVAQTQQFQRTTKAVRVVQQTKNRRLSYTSCLICLLVIGVGATTLVVMYWDEILVPRHDAAAVRSGLLE